jgi:signal transduction histidine kinase
MSEQRTSEVERFWQDLLELFSAPALILTGSGTIRLANSAFAAIAGESSTALRERPLATILCDKPSDLSEYLGACAASTRPIRRIVSWRLASGQELNMTAEGARLPIVPAAGEPEQEDGPLVMLSFKRETDARNKVSELAEDVHELSRENVERKRTEEHLQQALEDRDEFLSAASHELRNPLNALQLTVYGLIRMIRGEGAQLSPEQLLPKINRLSKQIARLTRLVDTLLDVSRLTSGRFQFNFERFDLAALTSEALDRLTEGVAPGQLTLDAPRPLIITSDRLRIDQVITNLLTNAIKYGEGKPVEVSLRENGPNVMIEVTDHGIGISEQDLGRIFERFERAVGDRTSLGFGLGLWIARGIVENLGGHIQARSTLGLGTTFTIEIPKERPALPPS